MALLGCDQEQLPLVCDAVAEGEIVITEIRGPQTGSDTRGSWVELHNASGRSVDLAGAGIRISELDGSGEKRITVRETLVVEPGGRAVLGKLRADGQTPSDMDFAEAFSGDFPDDGFIDVIVCGELIDRVVYQNLPSEGTLSFDGALEPDAASNDEANADAVEPRWCVDDRDPDPDAPMIELGKPGTPREENLECP